ERLDRIVTAARDRVADRRAAAALGTGREQLVECDDADEADLAERRRELVLAQAELGRNLFVLRAAAQLVLELRVRALDRTGLGAHRARDPVDRAQLVDDRALDPADRIGLELVAASGIELVDRVDQTEDAVADPI